MYKVILFDFDGTIADSFDNFLTIVNTLALKHNFRPIAPEEHEWLRTENPQQLMKHLKIPLYKLPFIARDMKRMQQLEIVRIKPFSGLPEVLKELKKRKYRLGILTSNGRENVESFLKENNIELFEFIHTDSSIFGKDKIINKVLTNLKLPPSDIIYVGDEIRDIQACHKAGIKIISVAWGFNLKKGLENHHPDHLINKPAELLKLLLPLQEK